MNIYERNFNRLVKVFGPEWFKKEQRVLKSGGFMDLHFQRIAEMVFSLAHYFEQNGDLVPDPDMEFRVFPETRMVEALTLQNQFTFSRVYPDPERPTAYYPNVKKELNSFLEFWLQNIVAQGFRDKDGEEP